MTAFDAKAFSTGVTRGLYAALVITAIAAALIGSTTTSHAGLTISDQRYWPDQVHAQSSRGPADAQASYPRPTTKPPIAACRYEGGPKTGQQNC